VCGVLGSMPDWFGLTAIMWDLLYFLFFFCNPLLTILFPTSLPYATNSFAQKCKRKNTLVCENIELLPSLVPMCDKLNEISKNVRRREITLNM
jgi:hypothetical protein